MLFMWSKVESFFKIMHGNSCVLGKPLFYPCLFPAQTDFCGGQAGTTTRVCGSGTDTQGGLGGGVGQAHKGGRTGTRTQDGGLCHGAHPPAPTPRTGTHACTHVSVLSASSLNSGRLAAAQSW